MIFRFKYKNKRLKLDVKVCKNSFSKMIGLMFKRKSKPLLFVFKKPVRTSIHSFFCKPFLAIWFLDDKIVDMKVVKPWKLFLKPKNHFNKILEIPDHHILK